MEVSMDEVKVTEEVMGAELVKTILEAKVLGTKIQEAITDVRACEQSQAVILISKTTVEVPAKGSITMKVKEDLHAVVVAANTVQSMTKTFTKEIQDAVHGETPTTQKETILLVGLRAVRIIAGRVEAILNLTMMTTE